MHSTGKLLQQELDIQHWAVIQNQLAVVQMLLVHGADLDITDHQNNTADELADSKGFTAISAMITAEIKRRALASHTGVVCCEFCVFLMSRYSLLLMA